MNPAYTYTVDDQMNPVYCIGCRQHIPLALSNAGAGYCPPCQANQAAQAQAAQQAQAAALAQQQAAQQAQAAQQQAQAAAHFQNATGMGICAQCHSPNISQIVNRTSSGGGGGAVAVMGILLCLSALCCLWPLAIIGVVMVIGSFFMPSNRSQTTSRVCNYCGNRWQV